MDYDDVIDVPTTGNNSPSKFVFFVCLTDHCPWVNNCVGIGNHKYFLLFVFYTMLSCIYSFSLVIVRFMGCMHRHGPGHRHASCLDRPTQLLSILGLVVEALLFGMFTACMIVDQMSVVTSKLTHIDRLKNIDFDSPYDSPSGGHKRSKSMSITGSTEIDSLAGVVEVFGWGKNSGIVNGGNRFRADWLSPFAKACFPASIHDEVMGFCRPCLGGTRGSKKGIDGNGESELTAPLSPTSPANGRMGANSQMVRSVTEIV